MSTSLKFGTSGLRGLAEELDGPPAYWWTEAFLKTLQKEHQGDAAPTLLIGQDLRASSANIALWVASAAEQMGWQACDCGAIPTPALALAAQEQGAAAIMVTGSHIPSDRNGLKFYSFAGEITKEDEIAIRDAYTPGKASSQIEKTPDCPWPVTSDYLQRYLDFVPVNALAGLKVGIFEQSSVARELMHTFLQNLGAQTFGFGLVDEFVPIDTEDVAQDVLFQSGEHIKKWGLDAVVSTDADADRPLVIDENARQVSGEALGLLCAKMLSAKILVTPISSNASIERIMDEAKIVRTKIGSPHVIAAMQCASKDSQSIVGFEANGGVLVKNEIDAKAPQTLLTRDAFLPILAALLAKTQNNRPLSQVVSALQLKEKRATRVPDVPREKMEIFLNDLSQSQIEFLRAFDVASITSINDLDGLRMQMGEGDVVHYRASGNAPELRIYVEADQADRADEILACAKKFAAQML